MSFDAWVVAFGLSKLVNDLGLIRGAAAYGILAAVVVLGAWLLYRFFSLLPPEEDDVPAAYGGVKVAHSD